MAKYSIKDLELLCGVKAHTIRIWEKRYGIIEPERTDTNIRYYCDEDLKRLLNISILNRSGYKISSIAGLTPAEIQEKVVYLTQHQSNNDSQIESLILSMIELDEDKFEKNLSRYIINTGFEKTITDIVYPFMERVGILWQIGAINPAQEHFVSNLIRQKIIVAIDGQGANVKPDAKKFVLYLPENEIHELGLLFYTYLLKRRGYKVVYLGSSLPYADLIEVGKIHHPDFILTSFTASLTEADLHEYLKKLSLEFSNQVIFITGLLMKEKYFKLPDNVIKIKGPANFIELLENKRN